MCPSFSTSTVLLLYICWMNGRCSRPIRETTRSGARHEAAVNCLQDRLQRRRDPVDFGRGRATAYFCRSAWHVRLRQHEIARRAPCGAGSPVIAAGMPAGICSSKPCSSPGNVGPSMMIGSSISVIFGMPLVGIEQLLHRRLEQPVAALDARVERHSTAADSACASTCPRSTYGLRYSFGVGFVGVAADFRTDRVVVHERRERPDAQQRDRPVVAAAAIVRLLRCPSTCGRARSVSEPYSSHTCPFM